MKPRRTLLLGLLAVTLVLNFNLFLELLVPCIVFFLLVPVVGDALGLVAASCCLNTSSLWEACRMAPWVPTPAADLHELLRHSSNEGTFLELGSGDGRNLMLALDVGFNRSIGLEWSPVLVAVSSMRAWLWDKGDRMVTLRADMMADPIPTEHVTAIYLYLSDGTLEALAPRLACAFAASEASVLSRDFALPGWGKPRLRLERGLTTLLLYNTLDPQVPRSPC